MDKQDNKMTAYCSTCLSTGRNLATLPRKHRKLFRVLLPFIDQKETLNMCWECQSCMHRIDLFHNRALLANKIINIFLKNQASVTALESKSTLGVSDIVLASIDPEYSTDRQTTNEKRDSDIHDSDNNCLDSQYSEDTFDSELKKKNNIRKKVKNKNKLNTTAQSESTDGLNDNCIEFESESDIKSEFGTSDVLKNESFNKLHSNNEAKKVKLKGRKQILVYKCNICDKLFQTRGSYYYHRERHNPKPRCDKCGMTFVSKSVLWTHNNLVHKNVKRYSCKVCNKICFTKTGYREHIDNHANGKNILFCKPCGKFFKTTSSFRRHQRLSTKHHDPTFRRFQCSECDRSFMSETRAQEHRDTVHLKVNKVTCHLCPKQYCTLRGLKAHVKTIHEKVELPRNKVCDICGKAFQRCQVLKTHQATHTGERPYACPHCGARFTQSGSLRTHIARLHPRNK